MINQPHTPQVTKPETTPEREREVYKTIRVNNNHRPVEAQPTLTIDPSSLVIKVGQNASARVTLLGSPTVYGMVCFSMEGLPASGFITSMDPECVSSEPSKAINSTLIVEATPAAAPQSFSAFVVASSATWNERAQLGITVVPALPAWIPWTMIVAFILVLMSPILVGKKRTKDSSR